MKTFMQKFYKAAMYVFTRAAVFYFIVFLASNVIVDYEKIKFNMQIRVLNSIMPNSFASLIKATAPEKKHNDTEIVSYIRFYQRVVDFFPEQADARAMLGFCYFHREDISRAMANYQKAFEINKDVFWTNYNLGILYVLTHQDKEAEVYLKRATVADSQKTLNFILTSNVIYRSIMVDAGISVEELKVNLKEGYFQANMLLLKIYERQKNFSEMILTAQNALKTNLPHKEFFYYTIGFALYQLKDYTQARLYFQECLKINSSLSDAYQGLALTFQMLGKDKAAVAALKKSASAQKVTIASFMQFENFGPRIF